MYKFLREKKGEQVQTIDNISKILKEFVESENEDLLKSTILVSANLDLISMKKLSKRLSRKIKKADTRRSFQFSVDNIEMSMRKFFIDKIKQEASVAFADLQKDLTLFDNDNKIELKKDFSQSEMMMGYFLKGNTLFQGNAFKQIVSNCEMSFQFTEKFQTSLEPEFYFFDDEKSVQRLLDLVSKYGVRFKKFKDSLENETTLNISQIQSFLNESKLNKEGVIDKFFCVQVISIKKGLLQVVPDSLELCDEVIEEVISFTDESFEQNGFFLRDKQPILNIGSRSFGAVYINLASIEKIEKKDLKLVQKIMKLKLKNLTNTYINIRVEDHFDAENDHLDVKIKIIYQKIEVQKVHAGDTERRESFQRFYNRMQMSNGLWSVVGNEVKSEFVFLTDLCFNICNLEKFESKGAGIVEVLDKIEQIKKYYEPNTAIEVKSDKNKILRMLEKYEKTFIKKINGDIKGILRSMKKKDDFGNLMDQLDQLVKSFDSSIKKQIWGWLCNKKYKSMTNLIKLFEYIEGYFANESIPMEKRIRKIRRFLGLFSFFGDSRASLADHIDFNLRKFLKMQNDLLRKQSLYLFSNKKNQDLAIEKENSFFRLSSLVEFYEVFITKYQKKEASDLRGEFNDHLKNVRNFEEYDDALDSINKLCLACHFDVNFSLFKVNKSKEKLTLEKIKSFIDFLKNNFLYLSEVFKSDMVYTTREIESIQKKIIKIFKKKPPSRKHSIVTHFLISKKIKFDNDFLKKHFFQTITPANDKENKQIVSSLIKNLCSFSPKLDPSEEPFENLTSSRFVTHQRNQYYSRRNIQTSLNLFHQATTICKGTSSIKHSDLVCASSDLHKTESRSNLRIWRLILNRIMDRETVTNILKLKQKLEYSIGQYIFAIYFLCDSISKQILAKKLTDCKSPVPFIYTKDKEFCQFRVFALPLSGMTLDIRRDNNVELVNPFFHKSCKFVFVKASKAKGKLNSIVNNLFYNNEEIFRGSDHPEKHFLDSYWASFASNYNADNKVKCFDLSMVIFKNRDFEESLMSERAVEQKEQFVFDMANVIVFLQSQEDAERADLIHQYVRRKNRDKPRSRHTLLIELIETPDDREDFQYCEYWHKRIALKKGTKHEQVSERIRSLVLYQKLNFELGGDLSCLQSLLDLHPKKRYKRNKMEQTLFLDLQDEETRSFVECSGVLVQKLERMKREGRVKELRNAFKLQSKFMLRLVEFQKEENLLKVDDLKLKNEYFEAKSHSLKVSELHFLYEKTQHSVLLDFIRKIISLDRDKLFDFLTFFEALLSHKKIDNVFRKDPSLNLKVINFLRETQQVYSTLKYFTDRSKDLGHQGQIEVLPKIMAGLFLKMYPMEILNGDHLTVPQVWLERVIHHVTLDEQLVSSNPKISVVSVMGLQSSGKSTFLNSLFRLSLSTKDDKCTRGSNAIMLKVDARTSGGGSQAFVPDYIVLVDTEGLKSPETTMTTSKGASLDFKDHRMILFNLGVSNLSIVNSMSEFKSEMVDVLKSMTHSLFQLIQKNRVRPLVHFLFQAVENNTDKTLELKKTSLEILEKKVLPKSTSKESDSEIGRILDFKTEHMHSIPKIKNKVFSRDYKKGVNEYLVNLFSKGGICTDKSVQSLDNFVRILGKMSQMVRLDSFHFDAGRMKQEDDKRRRQKFKMDLSEHIRQGVYKFKKRNPGKDLGCLEVQEEIFREIGRTPLAKLKRQSKSSRKKYLDQFYTSALDSYFVPNGSKLEEFLVEAKRLFENVIALERQNKFNSNGRKFEEYLDALKAQTQGFYDKTEGKIRRLSDDIGDFQDGNSEEYLIEMAENSQLIFSSIQRSVDNLLVENFLRLEKLMGKLYWGMREQIDEQIDKIQKRLFDEGIGASEESDFRFRVYAFEQKDRESLPTDFHKGHRELIHVIETKLKRSQLLIVSLHEKEEGAPKIEIIYEVLGGLIQSIIDKSDSMFLKSEKLKKEYKGQAMTFLLARFLDKIEAEQNSIKDKIKHSIFKTHKFGFQKEALSFDGLTWAQIFNRIVYFNVLNLHHKIIQKFQREVYESFQDQTEKKMSKKIHFANHLKDLQKKYFKKILKNSEKEAKKSFFEKFLNFLEKVPAHLDKDLKKVLHKDVNVQKHGSQLLSKVKTFYEEDLNHLLEQINSISVFEPNSLYKLTDHFLKKKGRGGVYSDPIQIQDPQQTQTESSRQNMLFHLKMALDMFFRFGEFTDATGQFLLDQVKAANVTQLTTKYDQMLNRRLGTCAGCGGIVVEDNGARFSFHIPVIQGNCLTFCFLGANDGKGSRFSITDRRGDFGFRARFGKVFALEVVYA